jgi:hypothetical protein
LYYLNSRYYNPEWGRFINGDGLVGVTGELLSHNMFAYCSNNPVNMTDPDGRLAFLAALVYVAPIISTIAIAVMTYAPGLIQEAGLVLATAGNQMAAMADKVNDGNSSPDPNNWNKGSGRIIKEMPDEAFKRRKIFSQDHMSKGFEKYRDNQDQLVDTLKNIVQDVDGAGRLTEGNWRINTSIQGMKVQLSVTINNGKLINCDAWPGWSSRPLQRVILWDGVY